MRHLQQTDVGPQDPCLAILQPLTEPQGPELMVTRCIIGPQGAYLSVCIRTLGDSPYTLDA